MGFVFLYDLLTVNWTHAIASTLLHSIWEGTLAAIVSGVIILTTKKCRASVRYSLHALVFLFFLVAVAYTFIREINNDVILPASGTTQVEHGSLSSQEVIVSDAAYNGMNTSFVVLQINYFLSKYSALIVFGWLLIFFLRFCSILTGIQRIHRLRKHGSRPAPAMWKHKLDVLACKIGITQHLGFLESDRISVPMVIGYFKPVIVVPLGLICRLPFQEMEAILLHELAHIRRRDYLVNLLQSIAENIFFFHPCILWISSLIREERENCCDDIAVRVTNDREQYIHALISFQEYNLASSATPAIAFAGTRHRLLDRVRRLLNHENKKLNQMEKMILMGSMVVLTSICVISTNDSQAQQRPHRESFKREHSRSENRQEVRESEDLTVGDGQFRHISTNTSFNDGDRVTTIIAMDEEGRKYKLKNVNGKTENFSIDGEQIDEDDFSDYRDVIKNIEKVSAAAREKALLLRQRAQERRSESEAIREMRIDEQQRRAEEQTYNSDRNRREAEKLMQKLHQKDDNRRNRERLEREEALRGEQQRLREILEMQTEANRNRNRNNRSNNENEHDSDQHLKRKVEVAELHEYKQQLHERELMQRAEQDANRSTIEQQRLREKIERAREIQERNAEHMEQQRALMQERFHDQIQRNREIQQRNREIQQRNYERMLQQRKAQQDLYNDQLAMKKQYQLKKQDYGLTYHPNAIEKPKPVFKSKPRTFLIKPNGNGKHDEIAGIIETLEDEEIIDTRERLSFTLTENSLIVNGRRQSSEIHERLKDRYIQKSGDHISYYKDDNTTRTTIQRN